MAGDTKRRIIETTEAFFRRQGYRGTGLKQISQAAGAPFGSLYHHFPEGKEQLCEEVIRWSGESYLRLAEGVIDGAPDAVTGVELFFEGAGEVLREVGYEDICPIGTVALEVASTSERLRAATNEVFESWIAAVAARLTAAGIPRRRARELGVEAVILIEGAFMLSRVARDLEPMRVAGASLAASVRRELERARGKRAPKRAPSAGRP